MKYFICLLINTVIFSQSDIQKVDIIIRPFIDKMRVFEKNIIDTIIKIHNQRNKFQLKTNYIIEENYNKIRPMLYSDQVNRNYSCGISGFTISKIKGFEFSHPYMPIQEVFISRIDFNGTDSILRCGFSNNPFSKRRILQISSDFKYAFIPYDEKSELYKALNTGEIDIRLADSHDAFFDPLLKIYENIDSNYEYLGIIFPKNSMLKKMLSPILKDFIHTKEYRMMVIQFLGEDFSRNVFEAEPFFNYENN
jgi:hypothetical protein